ncbi:MAG: 2-aminoethylphosphonate--pyruvate transaminase [Alphaproteobacteria bacterium]|nr:2-aminoethylphosphonate--pyruvate transaminase [Alphaproteobacteria bacterium]
MTADSNDSRDDPWLLTPGPLTTARETREAMLRDRGSRDEAFLDINARVCERLVDLAVGSDGADSDGNNYVCVPVQGSGTFAVEAALGTLIPAKGKALILVNGAYGARMVEICTRLGRDVEILENAEHEPTDVAALTARLDADSTITHVAAVHCETTSGILNPIEDIAQAVAKAGRRLLVDAMSSFAALPLNVKTLPCEALMASSNKCLEGVPGLGFVIVEKKALAKAAGNAPSLCLDLEDQWRAMAENGQWRFTPPVHVIAALDSAIASHAAEGGVAGRGARYAENHRIMVEGMRGLGFETLLPDALQAPIIVTFHSPADANFQFGDFYDRLRNHGYVIYPGKLTEADSFRIGCIGQVGSEQMHGLITAVEASCKEMGVTHCGP